MDSISFDSEDDTETMSKEASKLSEKTMLSLQLVAMLLVLVIWLVRLGDKVDEQSGQIAEIQRQVAKCNGN